MISRISGKLKEKKDSTLLIDINGISYEIFVPMCVMQSIEQNLTDDGFITLVTYHYMHTEPAKSIPMLIGFLNEIEKEFFEKFITVSGVGPKAAVKALSLPISKIAKAIDEADVSVLKSLPGIGQQRAKEIIAKLQGKVAKYGLIKDGHLVIQTKPKEDITQEALSVLLQLQYNKKEAKDMIDKALERNTQIETVEELLNEVYRQKG